MSADVIPINNYRNIPSMTDEAIEHVRNLEDHALLRPQVSMHTLHTLHGGVYTRSISIPAGVLITGALIKIPTTLIINGHCKVYVGEDEPMEFEKYSVVCAPAKRKQAFLAITTTQLTMFFATSAQTVEEAEAEFTDEAERLWSRQGVNNHIITGE